MKGEGLVILNAYLVILNAYLVILNAYLVILNVVKNLDPSTTLGPEAALRMTFPSAPSAAASGL